MTFAFCLAVLASAPFYSSIPQKLLYSGGGHTTNAPPVILTAAKQLVELLAPLEQGEHALQQVQRDSC